MKPNTKISQWNPIPDLNSEEKKKLSDLQILEPHEELIEQGFGVFRDLFTPQECEILIDSIRSQTKLGLLKKIFCLKKIRTYIQRL